MKHLIFRYIAFAILATIANLAMQRIVLSFGDSHLFFAGAVIAGTFVGLIVKYVLDKRWIFYDVDESMKENGQKFFLYSVMGLVTTAIFWGTETAFWFIWRTDFAREAGAILGLSIGYFVKYKLDRAYVFTNSQMRASS
jgi:putative flippase GtrA